MNRVDIPTEGHHVCDYAPWPLWTTLALGAAACALPALASGFVVWVLGGPGWLAVGVIAVMWLVGIASGLLLRLEGRGAHVDVDFGERVLTVERRRRDGRVRKRRTVAFDDILAARTPTRGPAIVVETRRQGAMPIPANLDGRRELERVLKAIARESPPLPVYRRPWFVGLMLALYVLVVTASACFVAWRMGWI